MENGNDGLTAEEIIERNRAKFISKQLGGGKPEKTRYELCENACFVSDKAPSLIAQVTRFLNDFHFNPQV